MNYRKNVLGCLGRFPEPCPLNLEIVQVLDKGSHTLKPKLHVSL